MRRIFYALAALALAFMWLVPESFENRSQAEAADYVTEVVNLTNAERRKAGRSNLSIDSELMAATGQRAREMVRKLDHTRPDGRSWDTVLNEFRVRSYNVWGENILYNMSDRPSDAVAQWMNSPGHRANILEEDYTHIGVGVYRNREDTYVVQIFVGR